MNQKTYTTITVEETIKLGQEIGERLKGGEVFEMKSDLGGGKTTFTKGLVKGFGSPDPVASPSFTISFMYTNPNGQQLHHFDFYRLADAGIMANELAEAQSDENTVVVVEWGEIVHDILPNDRIKVEIKLEEAETSRTIMFKYPEKFSYLFSK